MKVRTRHLLVLLVAGFLDVCQSQGAEDSVSKRQESASRTENQSDDKVFRFSLSVEPTAVDPVRISSSESNYFLVNLLRGLYFVDAQGVAQPEIASRCEWTKSLLTLRCEIKKTAIWSDRQAITAVDFVESWRRLVEPATKGLGVEVLSRVKNAKAIHKGTMTSDKLGARAVSDRILEIDLEERDPEFIQRLAHPALAATRTGFKYDRENAASAPYSGPYKLATWTPGRRIRLETNESYDAKPRPPVEILVIDDDETALNLYREGTLTFLRRLPTHYLKAWKDSKELHQIPVARFDYVGFGPGLRNETQFRQALANALNYEELKTLYSALGVPGCPGLAPQWMTTVPCLKFDLKRAQKLWAGVPQALKTKRWTLHFSRLGGDDIQKGMEWMQAQWKKHLGLSVDLKPVEQSVYLSELRTATPDLFRKGVGLDRSTCLAAVEIFATGDPENFIKLELPRYNAAVLKLRTAKNEAQRKKSCTEVVKILIDRAEVIPLGRIHFSILAKPQFEGWQLNPLNHLDLSRLRTSATANPDELD